MRPEPRWLKTLSMFLPAFAFGLLAAIAENSATDNDDLYRTVNDTKASAVLADECKRQMNLLFEACQAYQRKNSRFPPVLTDLLGTYIHDGSILICPVARELENFGLGNGYRNIFDDDPLTTYYNELNDKPVRIWVETPVPFTEGEIKHRLRKETPVGDRVPVIRCLQHVKDSGQGFEEIAINLPFDGNIYESHATWECHFVNEIPLPYLMPALFIRGPMSERMPFRMTDDPDMLDLSGIYNGLFEDPWWVGDGRYGLKALSGSLDNGVGKFGTESFDVRGVIQLAGVPQKGGFNYPAFPYRSKSVPVDRECNQIHLLHGTLYAAEFGDRIATLIIRYRDSEATSEYPIIYGRDVERMRFDANDEPQADAPVPVWTGDNLVSEAPGRKLRIYATAVPNPRPDEMIESLLFESGRTKSGPFILAISVD